jgi:hypothetical protein
MTISAWHLIGSTQPLRARCLEVGDFLGARLLTAKLCRLVMDLAFLQERRYHPYDKWCGTAFARLDAAAVLTPLLAIDQLTHADDAVVTHTNWPAHIADGYRREMDSPG